jgi:SAM-dependent methyltransferase
MTTIHKLENKQQNQSWSTVESSGIIEIISHYHLAKVITALYKTGLIAKINTAPEITLEILHGFNPYLLGHLLNFLRIHNILLQEDDRYYLTEKGRSILSDESVAQLCFYSEAYSMITSNIDKFITNEMVYGRDILRDGKSLGIHCDTLFKEYHTASVLEAIKDLSVGQILDIGCGGGQFLMDICKKNSTLKGIGLDISEDAINYARATSTSQGLQNRLNFVVADAFNLSTWPDDCFKCDILCGSGVVHEHFRDGEQAVITILNTYAELLEKKGFKAIVLGEPEIRYDLVKSDPDLYLVHIFTAQGYPHHREEWLELFNKTKLQCKDVYTRLAAGPRFNFFVLTLK